MAVNLVTLECSVGFFTRYLNVKEMILYIVFKGKGKMC